MSNRDATRVERRDPTLPPLIPEQGWDIPDPMRAVVPEYESYEIVHELTQNIGLQNVA